MDHKFVHTFPETLLPDTLYVSIEFGTAVHLCACGCGNEVVTPITPTDWSFTYNGETISLNPSIGNWSLPCGSHYWIRRNRVKWAARWTDEDIDLCRKMDLDAKRKRLFIDSRGIDNSDTIKQHSASFISRLIEWLKS